MIRNVEQKIAKTKLLIFAICLLNISIKSPNIWQNYTSFQQKMLKDVEKPAVFLHFQHNLILIVEKSPLNTHIFKSKLLTPFNIEFSTITQQFVENSIKTKKTTHRFFLCVVFIIQPLRVIILLLLRFL